MPIRGQFRDLARLADAHPKPADSSFAYGTAGFRMRADLLDSVMFRMGLLAALRSMKMGGRVIGVMITASHNPEADNGVKLVDPYGEMLEASWEELATMIANAADTESLINVLNEIIAAQRIDLTAATANVVYARDTRSSGASLSAALKDGLDAVNASATDHCLLTTPQLHYIVRCLNTAGTSDAYGEPTEAGYYVKLATAFKTLMRGRPNASPITIDCANGIGAPQVRKLAAAIGDDLITVNIVNGDITSTGKLNKGCGADYVKTNQSAPPGIQLFVDGRYCSFDGDADRIVFYYVNSDSQFKLLDGDKIAGLAAMFFKDLVSAAGLDIQVGVVQTAYANGNSTAYLTKVLQVPVSCAKTGVKHLHHEAEHYGIGVYFEANGHGTVLFSPEALRTIHGAEERTPAQASALHQLMAMADLINQTVGDAMSDLLLVEVILSQRRWTLQAWDQAYVDLPSRLVRVVVADRTIFETAKADTQLVSPAGLQERIDGVVAKYKHGRSFVRPSGTEDVVRVYAEAASRVECDELAYRVAGIVFDNAGGIGDRPAQFL